MVRLRAAGRGLAFGSPMRGLPLLTRLSCDAASDDPSTGCVRRWPTELRKMGARSLTCAPGLIFSCACTSPKVLLGMTALPDWLTATLTALFASPSVLPGRTALPDWLMDTLAVLFALCTKRVAGGLLKVFIVIEVEDAL